MATNLSNNASRFRFLEETYKATHGPQLQMVPLEQLADQCGLEKDAAELIMQWLVAERLLKIMTFGPTLSITHQGVRVVEEAREHRDRAVPPFPSYNTMFGNRADRLRQQDDSSGDQGPAEPQQDEPSRQVESRAAQFAADLILQDSDEVSEESRQDVTIRTAAASDVPTPTDKLGFAPYVEALASFLLSPETHPPLTLSIEGEWGQGKTSFMEQLRDHILAEVSTSDKRQRPVWIWFSPWRYTEDESVWASFALEFVREVSEQLPKGQKRRAWWTLLWKRVWRPGNRGNTARGLAAVFAFLVVACGTVALLSYAGLDWANALATNLLGSGATSFAGLTTALFGGSVAVSVCLALIVWMRLWPLVKRTLSIDVRAYLSAPEYAHRIPFVERFHKDFDLILDAYAKGRRVFVFIDDLDRCPPPRASALIRAINLLISKREQLVFVLAMDRGKVAAAIAADYEKLIPYLMADSQTDEAAPLVASAGIGFGHRFVEKFVQLPFAVPTPNDADLESYIASLGETGEPQTGDPARVSEVQETSQQAESVARQAERIRVFRALVDSPEVQRVALMVAAVLGRNPRRIKQFVNLLRLRSYIAQVTGLLDDTGKGQHWTLLHLGKLAVMELRWPSLLDDLDRDPQLLARMEKLAVAATLPQQVEQERKTRETQWLHRQPDLGTLLRLGCTEDVGTASFDRGTCSFHGLDIRRALHTAPRIRGVPELVRKELAGHVRVTGSVPSKRPSSSQPESPHPDEQSEQGVSPSNT